MTATQSSATPPLTADVLVAGAGAGGICAAVQAARMGARVLLVEKAPEIGGTGVHSPVGLVCKFQRRDTLEPINRGLHQELFPEAYGWRGEFDPSDQLPTYDHRKLAERYQALISALPALTVLTGQGVAAVRQQRSESSGKQHLVSVTLEDGRELAAAVFVDGTADGNLSALAGAPFELGRPGDHAMQSATLTFTVTDFDPSRMKNPAINTWGGYWSLQNEMNALYRAHKAEGRIRNPRDGVGCFAYPDGKTLLFNSNAVFGVDPTRPETVRAARELAETYVHELFDLLKTRHPAFQNATLASVSAWMGVREGRRILGDYVLTGEDCLGEARFDDMVAACAYDIDIHDPHGGPTRMQRIPNSQYYHIPYRCLTAREHDNLLLGSRCISGDFVAHSSYRVMSGITAIGQAAGAAAALAARQNPADVRRISPAAIRHQLRRSGQVVEGSEE